MSIKKTILWALATLSLLSSTPLPAKKTSIKINHKKKKRLTPKKILRTKVLLPLGLLLTVTGVGVLLVRKHHTEERGTEGGKSFEDLQPELEPLYDDSIITQHPLYFVTGMRSSGKSTFIFALQGHSIITKEVVDERYEKKEEEVVVDKTHGKKVEEKEVVVDDDIYVKVKKFYTSPSGSNTPTTDLHPLSIPITKQPSIYPTQRAIAPTVSFCDTVPLKDQTNKDQKLDSGDFTHQFILRANTIKGLLLITQSRSIINKHRKPHFKDIITSFVTTYFGTKTRLLADIKKIKASFRLIINQDVNTIYTEKRIQTDIVSWLNHDYNNKIAIALLIKENYLDQIDSLKNKFTTEHLDLEKISFFYPDNKKNITAIREKLSALQELDRTLLLSSTYNQRSNELLAKMEKVQKTEKEEKLYKKLQEIKQRHSQSPV